MLQNSAKFDALVAAAPLGIVVIDRDGIVQSFNSAAEAMFGRTAGEVIGLNVSILMPDPYRSHHDEFVRKYLETGENQVIGIGREVRARRGDGRLFWCDLSVCEVQTEDSHLFIGMLVDISKHKAVQQEYHDYRQITVKEQLRLLHRCADLEQQLATKANESANRFPPEMQMHRREVCGECTLTAGGDECAEEPVAPAARRQRILVVDDDRDSRFLIQRCLEGMGSSVDCVTSGLEAIESMGRSMSMNTTYSAITLDLHMPVMDGRQTAIELRRMGYAGPILGLTADIFSARDIARVSGLFDFWLYKPVTKPQLNDAIQEAIRQSNRA